MKKETLQRFKESILLLCFLLFLFSFSNKGFAHSAQNEKIPSKVESSVHLTLASLPGTLSVAKTLPSFVPFLIHASNTELKTRLDSRNYTVVLGLTDKKFLFIKTQIASVFYYRLFSLSGEIPA